MTDVLRLNDWCVKFLSFLQNHKRVSFIGEMNFSSQLLSCCCYAAVAMLLLLCCCYAVVAMQYTRDMDWCVIFQLI